jgi:hypothetical protein
MAEEHQPEKPWREIAEEVSQERDSDKIFELTEALLQALDKEARQRAEKMNEIKKVKPRRQSA